MTRADCHRTAARAVTILRDIAKRCAADEPAKALRCTEEGIVRARGCDRASVPSRWPGFGSLVVRLGRPETGRKLVEEAAQIAARLPQLKAPPAPAAKWPPRWLPSTSRGPWNCWSPSVTETNGVPGCRKWPLLPAWTSLSNPGPCGRNSNRSISAAPKPRRPAAWRRPARTRPCGLLRRSRGTNRRSRRSRPWAGSL